MTFECSCPYPSLKEPTQIRSDEPQQDRQSHRRQESAHGLRFPWPGGDLLQIVFFKDEARQRLVKIVHALVRSRTDALVKVACRHLDVAVRLDYQARFLLYESANQTNQASLIHDDVGDCGDLVIIRQRLDLRLRFAEPAQPGFVQLTVDLNLVFVLRVETDGLLHVRSYQYRQPNQFQ